MVEEDNVNDSLKNNYGYNPHWNWICWMFKSFDHFKREPKQKRWKSHWSGIQSNWKLVKFDFISFNL